MATQYGRNGFTVQEAVNSADAYHTYKSENLTLNGTSAQTTSSWEGQPAKEVVLFAPAGTVDDDGITINLKVNGAYGDNIVINFDNLPFTIKGLLVEEVKLTGGSGDDDVITVLSFH